MINNINSIQTYQKLIDINVNKINHLEVVSKKEDRLELSKEITEQIIIENSFKTQILPIKTEDEMTKTILDIKI